MKEKKWSVVLQWILIGIMIFVSLFPLYLVFLNAFKSHAEIVKNPLALPTELYWKNFTGAWKTGNFGTGFLNSIKLVVVTTLLVLFASTLAGYVMGMKHFRGKRAIQVYFLLAMTVPVQLFLFPLYAMLAKMKLLGNIYAVCFIIAAINMPLAVMLMRTFFMKVPVEIEESARLDGASTWQLLRHIVFPMVRPGLITVSVLVAINAWNEYTISTTFLQGEKNFTVTLGYLALNGGSVAFDQGMKMAGALMIIVPILIFFLCLQKNFVDGLTNGAVKE